MKKASAKRPAPARRSTSPAVPSGAAPVAADPDEIAPEYDFRGARPNPYAARYAAGATAVVLDPDVAAAFPSAERVNAVLRAVAGIIQVQPPAKPGRSRRSA